MVDDEGLSAATVRAYPKVAVDALLAQVDVERTRLRAALDAANRRIDAARGDLAAERGLRQRLGGMVVEAEAQQRQLDAEVAGVVERMLESAEAESMARTAAARAEVARRRFADSMQRVSTVSDGAAAALVPAVVRLDGDHATQVA